jgi:hypothetical protein
MRDGLMNNAKHWRDRAEEARANAEQMNDLEAKRQMSEIAAGYERLAQRAEQRLREAKSPSQNLIKHCKAFAA